jgi:tetratricopeptide (TPR) repeat protein
VAYHRELLEVGAMSRRAHTSFLDALRRGDERRPARWLAGAALAVAVAGSAVGETHPHASHPLGVVDFPVSCTAAVRADFSRAVSLLHHMTYPQARSAFEAIVERDAECAMAHWGVAMTLFQPLWPTRPSADELARGWRAVERARELGPPTERERLFVAAAAAFFRDPQSPDYWQRIRRWEQAMERLHTALPDDHEAAAFYALSLLATAPADTVALAHAERAAELLLAIYEKNPDHPGAMHYIVHASDAPGREREALDIVRRYEHLAPRNPHALHMPTHIYTRLGDWQGVIAGNLRAAEAALEHPAGDDGQWVWDEFPHAVEYLVYALLQRGEDERAERQIERLVGMPRLEPSFKTAFHLASTRARYVLERRDWALAAELVARRPPEVDWDRFWWPEAIAWFARGLGAARLGTAEEATAAARRLDELETAARTAGEELFARNIRVLALSLGGWLAHVEGDDERAVRLLREAVDLERATPKHAVTPGPTLPAGELLGDLLLELGRPADALAAYAESLARHPRRFNGLLGAARAAGAAGDDISARAYSAQLLEIADPASTRPGLAEARRLIMTADWELVN